MSEQHIVILGPSNAGKTALLASFLYSVSQHYHQEFSLYVQAQNDPTRHVLQHGVDFLRSGQLPFQGTMSVTEYDFLFGLEEENSGLWKRLRKGNRTTTSSRIHFIDSPGGSVFGEEGEDVNDVDDNDAFSDDDADDLSLNHVRHR